LTNGSRLLLGIQIASLLFLVCIFTDFLMGSRYMPLRSAWMVVDGMEAAILLGLILLLFICNVFQLYWGMKKINVSSLILVERLLTIVVLIYLSAIIRNIAAITTQ
jgi:hypothetical protein